VIILDTNVLSALMRREPPAEVVAWLDRQPSSSVWTTTITAFEIEYGLRRLAPGKRREALEDSFWAVVGEDLGGRVLSFDVHAALAAGELSAELEADGRTVDVRDVQIAGIARARRATVSTRNVRHFEKSCDVVNPWDDGTG